MNEPRPPAYLDAAAGSPWHPVAVTAWHAALEDGWADPTKRYQAARRARLLLDASRESVAEVVGARPEEVTFCASGTEAAHLAVLGTLAGRTRAGDVFVHSAVEHSAVLQAALWHADAGGTATASPVDGGGRVDLDAFSELVGRSRVAAAAVMSVNHEVGTRQPLDDVSAVCREAGVPLVVDAAQSLGRETVPDGYAVLSASAHKWGGPVGVGILVVRTGTRWSPYGPTDERERRRHAGVADLPAVVAAAAALRAAHAERDEVGGRLRQLTDRLIVGVPAAVPDVVVHGDLTHRAAHIVSFSFLFVAGEALQQELDSRGFAVSTGSSCSAERVGPSHVLAAMGVLTQGNVRISLHRDSTEGDIDRLLATLPEVVARLRRDAGAESL